MKNNVNRAFAAKKTTRCIVLGLLAIIALGVNARDFKKGEKIYINTNQSHQSLDWTTANADVYLYFYGKSGTKWLKMERIASGSAIFSGTFDANVSYTNVIVVRNSPGTGATWNPAPWNQTCDLSIPDYTDRNYLDKFWKKEDSCGDDPYSEWQVYTPSEDKIPSVSSLKSNGVTEETVHICPSAAGDPYSLRVKLTADKTDYAYGDVAAHGWFYSANGTTWSSKDGYAGVVREEENVKDILTQFPTPLPTTFSFYYYLHSNIPEGRRLLKIVPDADCDQTCTITAFETAISAVNADDNTYTLDGMVAFGVPNGDLVISCDGHETTINDPKSPQSFSLHGLPAATVDGVTTTATAYFAVPGDVTRYCEKAITINVPNAKEAVAVKTIDVFTKTTIELKPTDCDPNNDFVWIINGKEYWKADGAQQQWTIPNSLIPADILKDSAFSCVYKEYLPAPGAMDDLMTNGKYESVSGYGKYGQKSAMSDYDFWGVHQQSNPDQEINFYDTCSLRVNPEDELANGFAVVRNANKFHSWFAKVKAREGNNFALFDAATGAEGGNKKAWYAETSNTTNSKLKLKERTTYVLSFWAANINNYGEMDNDARFQFIIEDITNPSHPDSLAASDVLDLSKPEYRNNLWHQCSKTFTAKANCDQVRISVMNLNTNTLSIGNDFALDDIQFHPISVVSKVVKSQQQFNITVHEPKVTSFIARALPLQCDDGPEYKVAVEVKYKNPNSALVIEDSNPNVGNRHEHTLPAIAFDTEGTLLDTFVVTTQHHSYTWHAYFDEWTSAEKSAQTERIVTPHIDTANVAFSTPACTDLKTTLSFNLDYRFQQGKLEYRVDNLAKKEVGTDGYHEKDTAQQTIVLTFENIPADGKEHTLHVRFAGPNSCDKTFKLPACPFSPVLDTVVVSGVPEGLACHGTSYNATVRVQTPYPADGKKVILTYEDRGVAQNKELTISGNSASTELTLHDVSGTKVIQAAYADFATCKFASTSFDLPGAPSMDIKNFSYGNPGCSDKTTTLTFDVDYTYQQGNLTYRVDNLPAKSETIREKSKDEQYITGLTFEGIPADGKTHTLYVAFDGTNSCDSTHVLNAAPFSPVINSVTISGVPATVSCDAENYQAQITIKTPYDATGQNIVLSGAKDTTVEATGMTTTVTLTMNNIGGVAQEVNARYEFTTCSPIRSITDLTPPTRISCFKDEAVICEGEDYFWERHNHRYTAAELPVGVDTFAIGYDSLFVTVNAVPHIAVKRAEVVVCDDERQVRIPISILNGQPSDFSVEVNGSQETGVLDIAGDTALIFPLNNLAAGDYSALITSREAGALCTSQVVRAYFTVSISGQMYSKWTDLLFINNKDGLYEGYQWYEDGKEMEGETLQRLYNPNGLPGVYYCRLLTKDGRFVTTCPQAFDEVKPSRNENTTPQQVRATTTYDTMGRPISNTLQKGIYIVFEEMESGETRARKIAIYE